MKLYVAAASDSAGKIALQMTAEGPRNVLGPMMHRLKQEQGIRAAIYDDGGNFVSSTL